MDPDPSPLFKIIESLKKRGFVKEATALEEIFTVAPAHKKVLITDCPICGNQPEPNCILCDGTGELSSSVGDDEEDQRVSKELKLTEE